jgi:hypothetical protein
LIVVFAPADPGVPVCVTPVVYSVPPVVKVPSLVAEKENLKLVLELSEVSNITVSPSCKNNTGLTSPLIKNLLAVPKALVPDATVTV